MNLHLQSNQCKTCGGDLHRVGNHYVCQACGNKWSVDAADDIHVVDRANAWAALRDGDFDHAAELFELIHEKEPKDHEAYWGLALACAGIMYVIDYTEHKKVPTCNNIDEESFLNSKNVKKAIELAPAEIAGGYRQQAEQIEQIRMEWLQKARKEKPYDVFLSYKDSDREHGIDRTQDSIDAQNLYQLLVNEGFRVFFSRVSLHDKIAEHYEPYIYNAIKTAKVMIVFGEKPEYFNATWVRNEWTRFKKRIENGEKHKNSLIVVTKNMNPGDLPVVLRSRQSINADEMTFGTDLIRHIRTVVDASKSSEHVVRKGVESGQKGWKSKTITQNTITKRELGQSSSITSIDEKKSLVLVETFIKEKQWEEAQSRLDAMLVENPSFAEALWCQLLVRHKVSSNTVLMRMLDRFKPEDYARVEQTLKCASKEFAGRILDLFYQSGKILPNQVREKVYDMILPYRYERRSQQLKENFDWSISNHDFKFFKLLLSALETGDVDVYIKYNERYIQSTLDHAERRECTDNILAVDEGNRVARMYLFETALSGSTKIEPIVKSFEDVLKYSENIDADVEDALIMTSALLASPLHCEFAQQLPGYYTGDLKTIRRSLMAVGNRMLAKSFYDPAYYFFNLLVSLDEEDVDAFWGLCLSKIHVASEDLIINSPILLKDQAEYNKYLALVDSERRVACVRLAKKQHNVQRSRRRKRIRIVVSASVAVALVAGAVVTFTYILPTNQRKQADALFAGGDYAAACEMYQKLGDFDDSTKCAEAVKAIMQVQAANHAQAVETLLAQGIPVEITYKAEGGLLGGTGALALGHTLSTDSSIIPLGTEDATDGVSEMTSTYTNAAEFGGLATPAKTGYRFDGWVTDTFSYDISGQDPVFHMALKATWSVQTYAINYELNGGTLLGDALSEYTIESDTIKLPQAEKDGFDFVGWLCDGETEPKLEVEIPAGSYGNKSYAAQWEGEAYTITLDYGYAEDGVDRIEEQKIQCGAQLELPIPQRPGYEFKGWWEDESTSMENHVWERREDVRLVAKWRIIDYTIHYHANGGRSDSSNPTEYTVESESFTLKAPVWDGHTFLGWSTSEDGSDPVVDMTIAKGSAGDLELYAVWAAIESTVTLDFGNGTTETLQVTYGKQFSLPKPERSGYTFGGWTLNGTVVTGGICKISADCTLVAKWEPVSYTIHYTLNGGTNSAENPSAYTAKDTITLKEPTRTGYHFDGWFYDGKPVTSLPVNGTMKSVTLVANWTPLSFAVDLDANGGTCNTPSLDVTYGVNMTLPMPTRTGYEFLGWYQGENTRVTNGVCRLTEDDPLVAKWQAIPFTITYTLDGGTNHAENPSFYTIEDVVTLRTPTKRGYRFDGWSYSGQNVTALPLGGDLKNVTLVAGWTPKTVNVTLDANGGSVEESSITVTFDRGYNLPIPTRTGYTFCGWEGKVEGNSTIVDWTGVWQVTEEPIALTALWEIKTYTVTLQNVHEYTHDRTLTLNDNYVGGSTTELVVEANESLYYPIPAEREGYVFAGWYTSPSCTNSTRFDFTKSLDQNVTLYAKWREAYSGCDGTIALNGVWEGNFPGLDRYLYAFVSPVSQYVTIYTEHTSGDPYLELFDEDGVGIDYSLDGLHDDDHGNGDAEITWYVEAGKVYYIGFGSYGAGVGSVHLETDVAIDGGRVIADENAGYWYELGQTETMEIRYGETLILPANVQNANGKAFAGWQIVGTSTVIGPDESAMLWDLDADAVLKPLWQ